MNMLILLPFCTALLLAACNPAPEIQKISGSAQGTTYHIRYWAVQPADVTAIKKLAEEEFARIDRLLSNYRPDSTLELFNANQSTEAQDVPAEIVNLIAQARTVSEASNGCYDLTIKPLFELWGFQGDRLTPPDKEKLDDTLKRVGFRQLDIVDSSRLRKHSGNLSIDVSSIAQGYSVARIGALLEQQGIRHFLVEIGGELLTQGQKPNGEPWRIALEKPLPGERTMHKVLTIRQTKPLAVMTSGTYRHYFDLDGKRYSHILDARTGAPVTHNTVSVTVLDSNPARADAWSTALLCLGRADGMQAADQAGIAALFIEQEGWALKEHTSKALAGLSAVAIK